MALSERIDRVRAVGYHDEPFVPTHLVTVRNGAGEVIERTLLQAEERKPGMAFYSTRQEWERAETASFAFAAGQWHAPFEWGFPGGPTFEIEKL